MFSFIDYQPLENIVIKFKPNEYIKEIPIFKVNNHLLKGYSN